MAGAENHAKRVVYAGNGGDGKGGIARSGGNGSMNREKMIEAAMAFDSQQGCLIGRCFSCEADFAIEQVKAERKRIAAELRDIQVLSRSGTESPLRDTLAYCAKLEAE